MAESEKRGAAKPFAETRASFRSCGDFGSKSVLVVDVGFQVPALGIRSSATWQRYDRATC